ncbi:adenylate cyclase [Betaproteobacteria bacterium GR16-43]|nr:adenylate cyclase [Betaproteobacteria bacterium GR16-43]
MARNVEIKARVADLAEVEVHARRIATEGPTDIAQDDTFFTCTNGRLKLREFSSTQGQLIFYSRPDEGGPKVSDYWITDTHSPAVLRETLAKALGIVGRVRKQRRLYLLDRTRIHLDDVEGLGSFVELEVVLRDDESPAQGAETARQVMKSLGIAESQLVQGAYVDLEKRS